jgi:dimeric dUTPase (all-alpha-NTP-PPase superfamily)
VDKLEELLTLQKAFQEKYKERFSYTKFLVSIAMLVESVELMAKTEYNLGKTFKWWSNKPLPIRKDRVGELVDVLHFFLLYMIEENITADELFESYKEKLAENYRRQEQGY